MKTLLFLILVIHGSTIRIWSITWYPDHIQVCRQTAWAITLTAMDYTYPAALSALTSNWLKPDGDMNFIGALHPDVKSGKVNLLDFNELSRRWRVR